MYKYESTRIDNSLFYILTGNHLCCPTKLLYHHLPCELLHKTYFYSKNLVQPFLREAISFLY